MRHVPIVPGEICDIFRFAPLPQQPAITEDEMAHLLEPAHSQRFISSLGTQWPTWRESRVELNESPLH